MGVLRDPWRRVFTLAVGAPGEDAPSYAWSPDGRAIAFLEGDEIVTVQPDGSDREARRIGIHLLLDGLMTVPLYPPTPSIIGWSPDGERLLLAAGGDDSEGSIVSISMDPDSPPSVLVRPTWALRGGGASWQAVYP
jgi:Tol biopolymer transport system component